MSAAVAAHPAGLASAGRGDATKARVAIDAGQTGTKVRVESPGGRPVDLELPGVRTHEPLLPQLAAIAIETAGRTGAQPGTIAIGTSGLTRAESDAGELLRRIADAAPATVPERLLLAHDSVSSFLGALGGRDGAVVAAGTGVVTLAVGPRGVARVDGWGNVMGDAGSGHWIGRAGMDAVMRAHDGRGAPTALLDRLRARLGDLDEAYIRLQTDPDRVRTVAAFAEDVAELAFADPVARRICLAAARELVQSVAAALERTGAAPRVGAVGGVLRSAAVRERFEELVRERFPEVELEAPCGTGLDGAHALVALDAAHPLRALVSEARR